MSDQTETPPFAYPTHPDGRRKRLVEMTEAEQDAVLAAPVESLPADIRPPVPATPTRGFPGPRTKRGDLR
jgi:hypothetical protein